MFASSVEIDPLNPGLSSFYAVKVSVAVMMFGFGGSCCGAVFIQLHDRFGGCSFRTAFGLRAVQRHRKLQPPERRRNSLDGLNED